MLKIADAESLGKVLAASPSLARKAEDDRALRWLDARVLAARSGVMTMPVELTPSLARALLARNPENRRVSEMNVSKFARDIVNGAWKFNGEPIIVAADGSLNDGQHRCLAVIEADVPIMVVIVIGTDRDTRFTIDQGKNRMAADYLSMNGHTDANALAAAGGYVWQHEQHGRLSAQGLYRATKGEVLATIDKYPSIAASLTAISKKGCDNVGGRSLLAFCHWTFAQSAGLVAADAFVDALITGSNLSARDPVLYARNRLMAERGRLKASEKAELIFRAWNASRRGETPRTMTIQNGALPVVEG
jgi:hypothetical protein